MRSIRNFVILAAGLLFFCVVIHVFKFEENTELCKTVPGKQEGFPVVSTSQLGQSFRVTSASGRFNLITISLFNPSKRKIPCLFDLRTKKNGRILFQRKITLKSQTSASDLEEIPIRSVRCEARDRFYFELKSKRPYCVTLSTAKSGNKRFVTYLEDRVSDQPLFFNISNQEKISLFSWILRTDDPNTRLKASLLAVLSFFCWISACVLLIRRFSSRQDRKSSGGTRSQGRSHGLILMLAAVSLFCLIGITLLAGINTHARLLGAEDDAHITYRYSLNIAGGKGFRFNPDEKVLGTTTPLYALVLAFFSLFFGKPHVISLVVNLASILGSSLIVDRLLSRRTPSAGALSGGLIFLFFPMFYRVLGMETNFLIFLVLLGLYLYDEQKPHVAALVLGLAVLTRMEMALLWPLVGLDLLFRKKHRTFWTASGVFCLTLAPWFIFSQLHSGRLFPNTFYLKTVAGYSARGLERIRHLFSNLSPKKSVWLQGFITYLPDYIQHYTVWIAAFFAALAVSIKDMWRIAAVRLFLLWSVLYVAAYAALGVWLFIWYYVLAFSVIPLALAAGMSRAYDLFLRRLKKGAGVLLAGLFGLGLVLFEARDIFDFFTGQWYARHTGHIERYETYVEMSRYIKRNVPSDQTLGMEEIGILGYFVPHKTWDFNSLVHDVEKYRVEFAGENIPFVLTLMDPDYLVLNSVRLGTQFAFENYEEVETFPVREFPWTPRFYYSLLKKRNGRLIPCGDVYAENRLFGIMRITGWVVGSEEIKSVAVFEDGREISRTDILLETPASNLNYLRKNKYSRNTVFHITMDTSQLPNGVHHFEFWACRESKKGIFFRKTVEIAN